MQLKEVLKRELKSRNESLNSLSRNTKISLSVLHGWVNGVLPSAKNLHHIHTLSEYFGISVTMLLFNTREEKSNSTVLFNSEFVDDSSKYKIMIERIKK